MRPRTLLALFGGTGLAYLVGVVIVLAINLGLLAAAVTIVCLVLRAFGVI